VFVISLTNNIVIVIVVGLLSSFVYSLRGLTSSASRIYLSIVSSLRDLVLLVSYNINIIQIYIPNSNLTSSSTSFVYCFFVFILLLYSYKVPLINNSSVLLALFSRFVLVLANIPTTALVNIAPKKAKNSGAKNTPTKTLVKIIALLSATQNT
jgi:hypothetical protein